MSQVVAGKQGSLLDDSNVRLDSGAWSRVPMALMVIGVVGLTVWLELNTNVPLVCANAGAARKAIVSEIFAFFMALLLLAAGGESSLETDEIKHIADS